MCLSPSRRALSLNANDSDFMQPPHLEYNRLLIRKTTLQCDPKRQLA